MVIPLCHSWYRFASAECIVVHMSRSIPSGSHDCRMVVILRECRFDTPTSVRRGRRQLVNREFLSSRMSGSAFAMARFCTVADAASRNFFVEEQYKEA